MPRRRNISPGLTENEYLAEASIPARFLFAMLPCWADREGRIKDRPRQIKHAIFPWDDLEVESLLVELEKLLDGDGKPADFIHRYRDEKGHKVIQIVNFLEHQKPHHREVASRLGEAEPLPRQGAAPTKAGHSPTDPDPDPNPDPNPRSKGGSTLEPHLANSVGSSTKDALKSLEKRLGAESASVFAENAVKAAECSRAWLPWFEFAGGKLIALGATSDLRDMLKNMMDAKDPEKRQAKAVGTIRIPLAFIKKQLTDMLKANGIRKWPNFPKEDKT